MQKNHSKFEPSHVKLLLTGTCRIAVNISLLRLELEREWWSSLHRSCRHIVYVIVTLQNVGRIMVGLRVSCTTVVVLRVIRKSSKILGRGGLPDFSAIHRNWFCLRICLTSVITIMKTTTRNSTRSAIWSDKHQFNELCVTQIRHLKSEIWSLISIASDIKCLITVINGINWLCGDSCSSVVGISVWLVLRKSRSVAIASWWRTGYVYVNIHVAYSEISSRSGSCPHSAYLLNASSLRQHHDWILAYLCKLRIPTSSPIAAADSSGVSIEPWV